MPDISVERSGDDRYRVEVNDGRTSTTHLVSAASRVLHDLGVADADPQRVVHQSFEFLLEREPASSILREFSLDVIPRYFPEYRRELPARLAQDSDPPA